MILTALLLSLQVADSASAKGDIRRPATPVRSRPLVVVDAGHGGDDRGMKGTTTARKRVEEADITLSVARKLRESLRGRGVDVLMTRDTDTLIALRDRGRIANDAGA